MDGEKIEMISLIWRCDFCNRYETHNTWVAFMDKWTYPNNMDMVEYRFERRKK